MKEVRFLYIKAVAESSFTRYYKNNWQKIIKKTIEECSKIYEENFGIKLILKETKIKRFLIRTHNIPHRIFDYERVFEKESRNEFDITIAFTNAPFFTGDDMIAVAFHTYGHGTQSYKNLIVLSNPEKWSWRHISWSFLTSLLVHEIGHVFKARHSERMRSYMAIQPNTESCMFYYNNRERILKNKWQKLRQSASK